MGLSPVKLFVDFVASPRLPEPVDNPTISTNIPATSTILTIKIDKELLREPSRAQNWLSKLVGIAMSLLVPGILACALYVCEKQLFELQQTCNIKRGWGLYRETGAICMKYKSDW